MLGGMTREHPTTSVLSRAAAAAGLAPSVHNTQPWHWRVHPTRLELYADRTRQLGVADPAGRLLMISCGAALHHARVALAAEGWDPTVTRLPEPEHPDLLARLTPGDHVGVTPATMRRFQSARLRRSDRRGVTDTPVPKDALAAVRAAVEAERCHLHILHAEQISDLAVAAARADEPDSGHDALRVELAYWVGGDRTTGVGVPDTVIPTRPPESPVPHRDFGRTGALPAGPGTDRLATYAVVFGEEDTPADWLRAGEALSAAWLTACEQGVSLLPFTAPMEVATTRTILRRLLAGLGHPYLVLRLGLADPDHPGPPATPRLAPAQTVEIVDTAA
jgi:nitroreductase